MIARILFSTCWNLLWWIKTDFLLNYCMQWLQEYYFLHVGILCDCMQWLQEYYLLRVICSHCKNAVFFISHSRLHFHYSDISGEWCLHLKNSMCHLAPHSMLHLHYRSEWCLHPRKSMCHLVQHSMLHLHYSSEWCECEWGFLPTFCVKMYLVFSSVRN